MSKFPGEGIMPKAESQATSFLQSHPDFDGRGITVAIFDTGCDPGAPGLQTTPQGAPKFVDFVDCSGSGDVDMSKIVKPETNGTIKGLSGRTLKLNPDWTNPSGEYRIGVKFAYELFPKSLVKRCKDVRKDQWVVHSRQIYNKLSSELDRLKESKASEDHLADMETQIEQFKAMEKSYEDPGPLFDCVVFNDGDRWWAVVDTTESGDLSKATPMTNFRHSRQYARLTDLDLMNYSVNIYDAGNTLVIVTTAGSHGTHVAGIVGGYFPDAQDENGIAPGVQMISVKIGDSRLGSMETGTALTRALRATLDNKCDLINMSYGEPTRLANCGYFGDLIQELVNDHGVIFIASAGNAGPALTTVGAPGGTNPAVWSIGAYVSPSMMKAEYNLLSELPEGQYTWSSRGPTEDGALGVTVSACGGAIAPVPNWSLAKNQLMNGTSMASPSACGNVALFLSGLKSEGVAYSPHSVRRAFEDTARSVENVEPWALGHGLIQVEAAYQHYIDDGLADPIYRDLHFSVKCTGPSSACKGGRGIYLRNGTDGSWDRPLTCHVAVRAVFPTVLENPASNGLISYASKSSDSKNDDGDESSYEKRLSFSRRLELKASESWVNIPSHMLLTAGQRGFPIEIPVQDFEAGVYYAEVVAIDTETSNKAPLFRVPITIIVPHNASRDTTDTPRPISCDTKESGNCVIEEGNASFSEVSCLNSGQIVRRYYQVPQGATWVNFTLTPSSQTKWTGKRRIVLHSTYLNSEATHAENEIEKYCTVSLESKTVHSYALSVESGAVLEVVLAQFWSSLGDSCVKLELDFHGLLPNPSQIVLSSATDVARVDVQSFSNAHVKPSISLTHGWATLAPKGGAGVITRLSAVDEKCTRDRLAGNSNRFFHQLLLEYSFTLKKACTISPVVSLTQDVLYESYLGSQLVTIYDSNNKLVMTSDAFRKSAKLEEGTYSLFLDIRHDDTSIIEQFQHMCIALEIKLPTNISLKTYSSFHSAVAAPGSFGSISVVGGQRFHCYVRGEISHGNYTKIRELGPSIEKLTGFAKFGEKTAMKTIGSYQRPNGWPITYILSPEAGKKPPAKEKKKTTSSKSKIDSKEEKSAEDRKEGEEDSKNEQDVEESKKDEEKKKVLESMRDNKISWVQTLKSDQQKLIALEMVFDQLNQDFPKHLPLLNLRMTVFSGLKDVSAENRQQVLESAQELIDSIDQTAVAAFFGTSGKPDPDREKQFQEEEKKFKEMKSYLIKALECKTFALFDTCKAALSDTDDLSSHLDDATLLDNLRAALAELRKWVDPESKAKSGSEEKYTLLILFLHLQKKSLGASLELINDAIKGCKDKVSETFENERSKLFKQLGAEWMFWNDYFHIIKCYKKPASAAPRK